jgi:general nucleoside transport system permease protein
MTTDFLLLGTLASTIAIAVVRASAPLVLASLGGLISDLAGSINIALEGIMLVAAFFGAVASAYAPVWFAGAPLWAAPWIGCAAGLCAALLMAGLLAVFHLEFGADLIVGGAGLNILASGLTIFLLAAFTGDKGSTANLASFTLPSLRIAEVDGIPVLNELLNGPNGIGHNILVYVAFISVPAVALLLRHTIFGMHLRAVGENREAALIAGIPVKRIQYQAMLLSGALAGLGGIYLSMGYLNLFQADMTAGRGFLALAALFLGGRRPLGTAGASLLFGASSVLAAQLGMLAIPSQIVFMIPPLITITAMVAFAYRRELSEKARIKAAERQVRPGPVRESDDMVFSGAGSE